MNFQSSIIRLPTIIVTTHIATMYLVIDINYDITAYENAKYYTSLFIITYATEYCSRLRSGRRYIRQFQNIDNDILIPVFIVPVVFASLYAIGFSIVNLITATRVITSILSFIVLYVYHHNFSFIIPVLITYIPFITINLHILVISSSILLVDLINFRSIFINN